MKEFVDYCKKNKIYISMGLMLIYVLPVINNNISYFDDVSRIVKENIDWDHDGRLATTLIFKILSMGNSILNISPMPILFSIIFLSLSTYYFCFKFKVENLFCILCISLGIIIQPFYLENLSYLFDVLGMSIAVSLSIFTGVYASFSKICIKNSFIIFIALTLSLLFYQSSINSFFIIFIFCLFTKIERDNLKSIFLYMIYIVLISIISLLLNKYITSFYIEGWIKNRSETLSMFDITKIVINLQTFLTYVSNIYKKAYGSLCGITLLLGAIILFLKSNKFQKLTFPFLLVAIIFFISGPLIFLKEPIIEARVFLSFNAIYIILVYILFNKKNILTLSIGLFFLLTHFNQAYYTFNSVKSQNDLDTKILSSYKESIKNANLPVEKWFVLNRYFYTNKLGFKHYAIAEKVSRSFIDRNYHTSIRLNLFNIDIDPNFNIKISDDLFLYLKNCNNVVEFNNFYNAIIKNKTMIFDFDKNCPTHAKYILNQLKFGDKKQIDLNKKLGSNLELISLLPYKISLSNNVIFEFNESLYKESQDKFNVFYIHFHERGKDGFINADQPIHKQVQIGDKYYLLASIGEVTFDKIEKISFGFYDPEARKNLNSFDINVNN